MVVPLRRSSCGYQLDSRTSSPGRTLLAQQCSLIDLAFKGSLLRYGDRVFEISKVEADGAEYVVPLESVQEGANDKGGYKLWLIWRTRLMMSCETK